MHPFSWIKAHFPLNTSLPSLKKRRFRHVKVWAWEIVACTIAFIMMMAVAVTIYPHANRPLPQWRYGITINGLLSIYSIVLRGCLGFVLTSCIGQLQWIWFSADRRPLYDAVLYDNAGRGPWGSLVWLWKHHIKQPLTAFGALITLISMAIDPIVQQLVAPVNCSWQASELNATLPRRNYFGYESTLPMPPADSTKLERAVALGMISSGDDIVFQCPTGNCTFPETFGTLGFCSSCEDISRRLSFTYECCHDNITGNCTEISHPANCSGPGFLGINFVTSLHAGALNGPKILNITTPQLAQPSLDPACTSCIRNWATTPVDFNLGGMVKGTEGYSTTDTNIQLVFANTIFNSTNVNPLTGQQILNCDAATPEHDSWTCIGYGAASCTLSPCFRLYNASVTDGILSETLIDTIKLVAPSNEYPDDETINYFGLLDTQCPSPADMELLTAQNITVLGPEPQPSSRWQRFYVPGKKNATYSAWVPKNLTDPFQDDWLVPEDLWTQSCAYAIGREMALFMQKELFFKLGQNTDLSASMIGLPISVSTGIGTSDPWLDVLSSTLLTFEILGGSELMQRTYNYGNYSFALVEEIMANISESITRFMRTQEADPEYDFGAPVQGESLSAGTCLAVRWGWIAVPAAVTTCVLMLLTVIATGTAQSRLPPWKQSFLTWVFHGPRPQLHQQFQHQSGPAMQGMESASEGVYVTFMSADPANPHIVENETPEETRLGRWERVKHFLSVASFFPSISKRLKKGTMSEGGATSTTAAVSEEEVIPDVDQERVTGAEQSPLLSRRDLANVGGNDPSFLPPEENNENPEEFGRNLNAALSNIISEASV